MKEEVRDLSSSESSSQLMQNLQRRNNIKMKIDLPIMNYKYVYIFTHKQINKLFIT